MTRRIPSLDGLRAVAILAVLVGHATGTRGFPAWIGPIAEGPHFDLARTGVRVFFVISGYLITGLLLVEPDVGDIRLGAFYGRRIARLTPALAAYLAVVALLAWAGLTTMTGKAWGHALTYTVNYQPLRPWAIGHLWSLSVEEQFYLLWPLTLALAGRRRAGWVAIGTLFIVPWIRMWEITHGVTQSGQFETTADALALGCALALWESRVPVTLDRLIAQSWVPVLLLVASSAAGTFLYRSGMLTQDSLANLACGVLVLGAVRHPTSRLGRVLNRPLLIWIGGLSYSLYLWQELFMNRHMVSWPTTFPLNVMLAFCCAVMSYRWVEQPGIAVGRRLVAHHDFVMSKLSKPAGDVSL